MSRSWHRYDHPVTPADPSATDAAAALASGSVDAATAARLPVAVMAGLFLATLGLRPPVIAIGPLAPLLRQDLGVEAAIVGLLTTIPVLCMGLLAPVGPSLASRLGPRLALAVCLVAIALAGIVRAIAPTVPLVLLVTVAIGIAIGIAGPIPSMVVADRMPSWRALGTGAYAGGIVLGSTLAAALAVPLAAGGHWRWSLLVFSVATFGSV